MPAEPGQPVTELLRAAQAGDAGAAERLLAVVYQELHQLARARMAHLPPGQTLQPTSLLSVSRRYASWTSAVGCKV